jgi:type II secretory pathway pseudopilin PulG
MVVIAVIGILAAIGSVAYARYIKSGKITKLQQIALEVSSGQERYRSRNNKYFSPGGDYATETAKYQNLLDFGGAGLPPGVEVTTEGWAASGSCTICAADSLPFDATSDGYAVVVKQDLDPDTPNDTTVYLARGMTNPIVVNEGQ